MSSHFLEVPNLLDQFSSSLIVDKVSVIEFVESDKYLGRQLYPRQRTLLKIIFLEELDAYDKKVIKEWQDPDGEVKLVSRLEERMKFLRDNGYPHFSTIQLVGGRRSSKGFLTACCMAYKLYQLTQLESLHKHFNIPQGKEVEFSIVAASLDQAVARQFADAFDAIVDIKPLQKQKLIGKALAQSLSVNTPSDLRRTAALRAQGMRIEKDMASLIVQAHGTNSKTIRGAASMMFVFDEMAHLIGGESRMSDIELWTAAIPSVRQFRKDAMIFANSSPYTKTGKFYELYEQSNETDPKDDPKGKILYPDQFMIQFPSWELYKEWKQYKLPMPQVLHPKEDPQLQQEEQKDPDSFKVEYRAQFAEVVDAFLAPEMVDRMFDPKFNFNILKRELEPTRGAVGFMRYKGHGDPASVKANFGIAIGHVEPVENPDTGLLEEHVVLDVIDAFYPEDFKDKKYPDQPGTIDWLQVVPTITHLINAFRPFEFTFDQFDSSMAIQQLSHSLKQMGIGDIQVFQKFATHQTNERRWKNFRAALNLGRVHAPHPDKFNPHARVNSIELAREEFKFLQEKNGRVDKQTIGPVQTKDIADCIAEVTDALIGDTLYSVHSALANSTIELGAQGGYSLGNTSQFGELANFYGDQQAATRALQNNQSGIGRARGHRRPER